MNPTDKPYDIPQVSPTELWALCEAEVEARKNAEVANIYLAAQQNLKMLKDRQAANAGGMLTPAMQKFFWAQGQDPGMLKNLGNVLLNPIDSTQRWLEGGEFWDPMNQPTEDFVPAEEEEFSLFSPSTWWDADDDGPIKMAQTEDGRMFTNVGGQLIEVIDDRYEDASYDEDPLRLENYLDTDAIKYDMFTPVLTDRYGRVIA
jgi:hypothetical protein